MLFETAESRLISELRRKVEHLQDKCTALEVELALVRDPVEKTNAGVTFYGNSFSATTGSYAITNGVLPTMMSTRSGLKSWP